MLAAVVALVAAGLLLLPVAAWLDASRIFLSGLGAAGSVLFVVAFVLATATFAPAAPFSFVAGLMFGALGLPVAIASATAGGSLAFLGARYFGRARVAALAVRYRRFQAIDRAIDERGWRVVALIRLSPLIPFNVQSLLFGATRVAYGPFVGGTAIGIAPNTAFYVYLGAAGRAAGDTGGPVRWVLIAAGLVATLIAAIVLTRAARRRMLAMPGAGRDEDDPPCWPGPGAGGSA